jgi:hypothetical protein
MLPISQPCIGDGIGGCGLRRVNSTLIYPYSHNSFANTSPLPQLPTADFIQACKLVKTIRSILIRINCLGRWVAKVGRWVAKLREMGGQVKGDGWLRLGRWVAKVREMGG